MNSAHTVKPKPPTRLKIVITNPVDAMAQAWLEVNGNTAFAKCVDTSCPDGASVQDLKQRTAKQYLRLERAKWQFRDVNGRSKVWTSETVTITD